MDSELARRLPEQIELFPDILSEYQDGRDELNLAEFPICAVGARIDRSQKTITYRDRSFDRSTGETISRKLIITAADAFGLPTSVDDEILLGMLQLSRIQGFQSEEVFFTPYQLLKLLGWPINTFNYRRLKDGIKRWAGVTLNYEKAWRDKKSGAWVDATFHFIDNVEFYQQGQSGVFSTDGQSYFKWNEVVFKNFQSGNLKSLDFHRFRALKSGIAKRMYRFLDKRFYHRDVVKFDLEVFAFEKIGLVRSRMDAAQIKRRLMPAIRELEEQNFIKLMNPQDRFTKLHRGKWEVRFERATEAAAEVSVEGTLELPLDDLTPLQGRLVGHGVTSARAKRLTADFDAERVEVQVDALEYLLTKDAKSMPENRAGWLVKAIEENYGPPRGFKSKAQRETEALERVEKLRARAEARKAKEAKDQDKKTNEQAIFDAEVRKVEDYLDSLSPAKRDALEAEALSKSPFGRMGATIRRTLIHQHVLAILTSAATGEGGARARKPEGQGRE